MITAKQVYGNFFIVVNDGEKIGNLTMDGSTCTFRTRDNIPIQSLENIQDTINFVNTATGSRQTGEYDPVLKAELFKKDNREYYYVRGTFKIFYSYKDPEVVVDPKQKTLHRHPHVKL